MKKLTIVALTLISLFIFLRQVQAVSPSPTVIATPTNESKQLEDLKERLATKVAELRRSEKRAIFGTVKSTSLSSFIVETKTKDVKIELTDDIKVAQMIKGKRTKLTIDDVAKDDVVTVFGDYDTTLDLLQAKAVYIQSTPPIRVNGQVAAVNKKEYTLDVISPDGQTYIIDIETDTKMLLWTQNNGFAKLGFSKLTIGDTVQIVALPEPKQTTRVSAHRILNLGNLSGTTPTPTPTTAVTPTGKTTPANTPKTSPSPTSNVTPKPSASS